MDVEKSDRLRSMLQEALLPIIKKMDKLEKETETLKKGQDEMIQLLKDQ